MPNDPNYERDIDFSGWKKQIPQKKTSVGAGVNRKANSKTNMMENEDIIGEIK